VVNEARPFLLQYFSRALVFGAELGLNSDDYKAKNIRLKTSVAASLTGLRLGDISTINDIAYFIKGKRLQSVYTAVPPGDELTVAKHALELRMTLPSLYEMLGLPGSGKGTHLDKLDRIIQLVSASDFLVPQLQADFYVHLSSISARVVEAISSHLQAGLQARNAARVYSRAALELAADVDEYLDDCGSLLDDFSRFHGLLPTLFPTRGGTATPKKALTDPQGALPSFTLVMHACHSVCMLCVPTVTSWLRVWPSPGSSTGVFSSR